MKTLRPGPRPFVALGAIFGLMLLAPVYIGVGTGKWTDAGKIAAFVLAVALMVIGPTASLRVEVDGGEIRLKKYGIIRKRVSFTEIGFSIATVLAERDWPLSLTIVGKDQESELMSINLKVLRKKDVAWLLALPELKVER